MANRRVPDVSVRPAPEPDQPMTAAEILARRLADPESVNASPAIFLKDDPTGQKWKLRIANLGIEGRHSQMTAKGWVRVSLPELANLENLPNLVDQGDGCVRFGEKGLQVLYKIPRGAYEQIKRKEADILSARTRSKSAMQSQIASAAVNRFGADGAEQVYKMVGEIRELEPERARVEDLQNLPDGDAA